MTEGLIADLKSEPTNERRWAEWYKSVYPKIYFAAYRLTRGNIDATRDITQEAFARFVQFRGLEKVADDSSAVAYLLRTCRNVFLDGVKQDRRITTDTSVDLETIESDATTPDPLLVIDRLAKKLDADDQRFFKMTRDGRTLAEIATTLGISYTAAGVRLHRIKKRLRDLFG